MGTKKWPMRRTEVLQERNMRFEEVYGVWTEKRRVYFGRKRRAPGEHIMSKISATVQPTAQTIFRAGQRYGFTSPPECVISGVNMVLRRRISENRMFAPDTREPDRKLLISFRIKLLESVSTDSGKIIAYKHGHTEALFVIKMKDV